MADFKLLADTINKWFREHEEGGVTRITFENNGSIAKCTQTEVGSVPGGCTSVTEAEFNAAADACATYAKLKSKPVNYLPPH